MELELKHLAAYLPYGLKVTKKDWAKIFKMDNDGTTLNCVGIDYILKVNAKPILRPLSYLTKEEVNGFSVGVRLQLRHLINNEIELFDDEAFLSRVSYYELDWLFERHFDVFGLIEKGLAIDINTLE